MQPKSRHPGSYYHVVRRTHRGELRLRPDDGLNGAVACLIQDACESTGVRLIALVVMGNHIHALLYDPRGRLSAWMAHVHGTVARYVNDVQDQVSHVWDAQELKDQRLGDMETVARVCAYIIANPVAAGLVYAPSAYPGICTTLKEVATGRGRVYQRPGSFFQAEGVVAEEAMIAHECPDGIAPDVFRAMVARELRPLLRAARADAKRRPGGFLGAEAVCQVDPFQRPASEDTRRRSGRLPADAAATDALEESMGEERVEFEERHFVARRRMERGEGDCTFPAGTWKAWRYYGALREPAIARPFAIP